MSINIKGWRFAFIPTKETNTFNHIEKDAHLCISTVMQTESGFYKRLPRITLIYTNTAV